MLDNLEDHNSYSAARRDEFIDFCGANRLPCKKREWSSVVEDGCEAPAALPAMLPQSRRILQKLFAPSVARFESFFPGVLAETAGNA